MKVVTQVADGVLLAAVEAVEALASAAVVAAAAAVKAILGFTRAPKVTGAFQKVMP